jgi:hypothetical protein
LESLALRPGFFYFVAGAPDFAAGLAADPTTASFNSTTGQALFKRFGPLWAEYASDIRH